MTSNGNRLTRRAVLAGGAAFAAAPVIATPAIAASEPAAPEIAAPKIAAGQGTFRRINLANPRTGEWLNTVYWADGGYIPEAMKAIDYLMRDWRLEAVHRIDPRTIDILSAAHALLDCSEPIRVVSGYRTPATNRMLRRRSRGVARNSYHIKGMAVDIQMSTRTVAQIGGAGRALGAGGVGCYWRSEFVHLDSGPVRDWTG